MDTLTPTRPHLTGDQVREARTSVGMTQTQFAKALDVSVRTVENWEQEHGWPSQRNEDKIAQLCTAPTIRREQLLADIISVTNRTQDLFLLAHTAEDETEAAFYHAIFTRLREVSNLF